jgi:hypothetical protein
VFQNSDVCVFFLDIVPRLAPGVLLHLHDIFLPYDYPPVWYERYYSEQYLLAVALMQAYGGPGCLRPILPNAYISHDPALRARANRIWSGTPVASLAGSRDESHGVLGTSFWSLWTAK